MSEEDRKTKRMWKQLTQRKKNNYKKIIKN